MSEQVMVNRDALEMLLRNHTVFGDYPQNYDTFCASCGRPKPFADQPGTHEHTCPVPSLAAALTAPAPASGEVEIINPRGRVAYRRPLSHPDVLEALQRPGYSVRKSEKGEG